MPDFDRIDLMNYAMYGNDFDPQWDEIRSYLKSSATAQRELEEIKKTIPHPSPGKRQKISPLTNDNGEPNSGTSPKRESTGARSEKTWWQKILGD
ncbi:hypothetical protein P3G55_19365 [Leptospira sp. 96542]|nr:hypothetical protein [Leptospira sp. 96542]